MPCPDATCGVHTNGMGGAGLSGCRTGDVRPAETGGASLLRILRLDPQRGGWSELTIVACLLRRSNRRTSLPTLTLWVCPPAWSVISWGPWAPYGGRARPLTLRVGQGGRSATPHRWGRARRMSDPGLQDWVHNVVHTGIGDRTCPIPYLCCTLLACEVELVDTEGSYSSCTRVRFLS
jgi:hypothetical protein